MGSAASTLKDIGGEAVRHPKKIGGVVAVLVLLGYGLRWYDKHNKKIQAREQETQFFKQRRKDKRRVAVDYTFYKRLRALLPILVPGVATMETFYMVVVAASLIIRTLCDLWVLENGTAIERSIITRDPKEFIKNITLFWFSIIPISVVNNVLKYGLNELALLFRARLTKHLYKKYLAGFTYYKLSNLDSRIANPDQLLTTDVDKFCHCLADLYSNISKPILDIFIYSRTLTNTIGFQGPGTMLGYLVVAGLILTRVRRPMGRLTVQEQQLEGDFRFVNSRLITHSEEVAFYQGNKREHIVFEHTYQKLFNHLRKAMQFRFFVGIFDSFITKYLATSVGYFVVSRPFLDPNTPKFANLSYSALMEEYYKSGRMLVNLAMAVGRLVLAGRELTRLAGYTARVTELVEVLKDITGGQYVRQMVEGCNRKPGAGKILEKDYLIKFDKVPIVTPNGEVLIESLDMEVQSGDNVIIRGPNGCGKSSLFRTLGELWPLWGGTMTKPAKTKLFYVPQRPYLALGTLRDQIIYPHSKSDMTCTDADLAHLMKEVHLEYLIDREGWDSVHDWKDLLSGGEKQRVAMARLFYHKPQFAILDECTSAVSIDVEGFLYTHCRELGITLFTVSHRDTLWKYHEKVLAMDGKGGYKFDFKENISEEDWGNIKDDNEE